MIILLRLFSVYSYRILIGRHPRYAYSILSRKEYSFSYRTVSLTERSGGSSINYEQAEYLSGTNYNAPAPWRTPRPPRGMYH